MIYFRTMKEEEGIVPQTESLTTLVCIERMDIQLKKSGVPTCPLDGVTIIRMGCKYF
jgi:hypothetical protein